MIRVSALICDENTDCKFALASAGPSINIKYLTPQPPTYMVSQTFVREVKRMHLRIYETKVKVNSSMINGKTEIGRKHNGPDHTVRDTEADVDMCFS